LAWQGAAWQTHSGSRAVAVCQGSARRGMARPGGARQTHSGFSEPLQFARRGLAGHGAAGRGNARQTHSGSRAVAVCWAGRGKAGQGGAWQTHSGFSEPLQFALLGMARPGEAWHGTANTPRFLGSAEVCSAWRCIAGQGRDRPGMAWHNHPANHRTVL